ncbi:hypothetical protein DTW94_18660 [Streptomyces cavourensis]|uniref:Uncharacterized protein n=1 Tax=Streptomyces cavourensis TaxID=67258 RepID=A0AAD0VFS2_9ACTN|nr:hypothetical protein DTW94_18660 [Streptomyces cavourensis]
MGVAVPGAAGGVLGRRVRTAEGAVEGDGEAEAVGVGSGAGASDVPVAEGTGATTRGPSTVTSRSEVCGPESPYSTVSEPAPAAARHTRSPVILP